MNTEDYVIPVIFKFIFTLVFFLTFPVFGLENHANFILVSNTEKPSFVELTNVKQTLNPVFIGNSSQFKNVLTFYTSEDREFPSSIAIKNKIVFLVGEGRKLQKLGYFLPITSKILTKIENSVSQGRVLLGFVTQTRQAGALVVDAGGIVYSVIRNPNRLYSIMPLGQLG